MASSLSVDMGLAQVVMDRGLWRAAVRGAAKLGMTEVTELN